MFGASLKELLDRIKIAATHIELEQGQVPTTPTTLHTTGIAAIENMQRLLAQAES